MAQAGEQLIPIDIHYNKLLDWLIDRRHCELRWVTQVKEIRDKLQKALQDLPSSSALKEVKSASIVHYFHVVDVIEELKNSESDSVKNIFGQYSSQRMKNWQEVQRLYEKSSIYLAESAQILARNVNYEIPALKRQISRAVQQQQECDRKEAEYLSTAKTCKETYRKKCRELGVVGESPKTELLQLSQDLPQFLDEIATLTREGISEVIEYYLQFITYVRGSLEGTSQLDVLRRLVKEGNISVLEWETGEKPQVTPVTSLPVTSTMETSTNEIDWGDLAELPEVANSELKEDVIDLDSDFNITIEDTGITVEDNGDSFQTNVEDFGIEVESEDPSKPSSVRTVLECPEIRNRLLDDLSELQSFLTQRIVEKKEEDLDEPVIMVHQFDSLELPQAVKGETGERLMSFKTKVDQVIDALTSQKISQLFLIRTSPTYVDRVVESLQFHLQQSSKAVAMATSCSQRRQEALSVETKSHPILEQLRRETQHLKSKVAMEISKRYSNRTVNIMGDISLI